MVIYLKNGVRPDDRRFFLGLPFFLGFCFPAGRHFLGKLSFAVIFINIKTMKRREKIKKNCFQATNRPFQFRKMMYTKNIQIKEKTNKYSVFRFRHYPLPVKLMESRQGLMTSVSFRILVVKKKTNRSNNVDKHVFPQVFTGQGR